MLDTFRRHAHGVLAKILIALLVLSFAIWGVGDMVRNHGFKNEIAHVGNSTVSMQSFQRSMRQATEDMKSRLGANYSPELAKAFGLDKQVLNQLINRELFLQEAQALGLIPTDEMIAKKIRSDYNFKTEDGDFDPKLFQQFLRSNGLSEKNYVERLREQLSIDMLSDAITDTSALPSIAVQTLQALQLEKREASIYVLPASLAPSTNTPDEDALKEYYNKHLQEYTTPEYRSISYVTLESENDLTSLSNKLEDALAGGSTLDEAAKNLNLTVKHISDISAESTNKEGKKISLPEYPNFLKNIFKTESGEDSAITTISANKAYLIHVDSVTPAEPKSFESVKSSVSEKYKKQATMEKLQTIAEEVAKDFADTKTRSDAIKKYNLQSISSGLLATDSTKTASGTELPAPLIQELFSLPVNGSTKAYPAHNDSFMIAVLKSRKSADTKEKANEAKNLSLKFALERQAKSELMQQYLEYLRAKHRVVIEQDALQAYEQSMIQQEP